MFHVMINGLLYKILPEATPALVLALALMLEHTVARVASQSCGSGHVSKSLLAAWH
jgi:hypothetical protein